MRSSSRLPRTLGRGKERSNPWFRRRLRNLGAQRVGYRECSAEIENTRSLGSFSFASGSEVGSESQTQRFEMLAGEQNEISLEKSSFYTKKKEFLGSLCFFHRLSSPGGAGNAERGFGERDADRRRLCLFVRVRGFLELPNGGEIYWAHSTVSFLARNDALSGCNVTIIHKFLFYYKKNCLQYIASYISSVSFFLAIPKQLSLTVLA